MNFKDYPNLNASSGKQTLPKPMRLHNYDSANVTYAIYPGGVYSPLKGSANVLGSITENPTFYAALGSAAYDITSDMDGSGGKISATVANTGTGIGSGFPANLFAGSGTPFGDQTYIYEPTSDGSGTGFKVEMAIFGMAVSQTVIVKNIINPGSGYAAGDVLTFTAADGGTFTLTLAAADLTEVFKVTAATVNTAGANYQPGENAKITIMGQEVTFSLRPADLNATAVNFTLAPGETTPFTVSEFSVVGTTQRDTIAFG